MKSRICCIFNLAPHYRAPIYTLMDRELNCDFYFGNQGSNTIKTMDVRHLSGYCGKLPIVKLFKGFEWQKGAFGLLLKPYKYYIITGTPGSLSNWLLIIGARLSRKKVLSWSHGIKGDSKGIGRIIEKYFFIMSHCVLLYGHHSKNNMLAAGIPNRKLIPIYNSLNYEEQLSIRESVKKNSIYSNKFGNKFPVLAYIGRLQANKRLDLLIEAINSLKSENYNCNLILIGAITDDISITELVKSHELNSQVWFYGPCYEESEIGNLLFNADLCVSPGPIGLTALHALTYGLPILTNDNFNAQMPEFEAIEKGKTGDFFKDGNIQDLADKIKLWTKFNEGERNEIRNRAYKKIDEVYNPGNQIKILKSVLNSLS